MRTTHPPLVENNRAEPGYPLTRFVFTPYFH